MVGREELELERCDWLLAETGQIRIVRFRPIAVICLTKAYYSQQVKRLLAVPNHNLYVAGDTPLFTV